MLKARQDMIKRVLCKMYNIFYEHYKKRDGAIYKDLAYYDHKGRIKLLNEFILSSQKTINQITKDNKLKKQYESLIGANKRSIRYFLKLMRFCNKHKDIKGFVQDV
jgi:hypothetical protein